MSGGGSGARGRLCGVPFFYFQGGEMRREQNEEKGAEERPEIGGGRAAWLLMARGAAKSLRREETAHETAPALHAALRRGEFLCCCAVHIYVLVFFL